MHKKILYLVTQPELGGAQRYCFDLASNLQDKFDIAIAFGEQGEKGELVHKLKEKGFVYENKINQKPSPAQRSWAGSKIYIIPHLKRALSPLNDILALFEIIKLIKKLKPDIIHLNSTKISILGSLAAKMCSVLRDPCYVIFTAHGWVFNEPLSPRKKLFYKYAEKFTARFKDKIICVSEYDKQAAIKEKIAPARKLVTVHNGIERIDFLSREQARQQLSQITNYQLPITKILIGTIGNLYKTKGFAYLIEAAKILKKIFSILNSQFSILIIGEGPERKNLAQLIKKHNLENTIFLAGRIDKAHQLLPAFDIYACSSVKEGLSYTIVEAAQAGLPIAATKVGGNPEIITDKKSGLLADSKNPEQLAEAIKKLIDNKELGKSLGAQAKQDVLREFGLEKMIKETKKIYFEK